MVFVLIVDNVPSKKEFDLLNDLDAVNLIQFVPSAARREMEDPSGAHCIKPLVKFQKRVGGKHESPNVAALHVDIPYLTVGVFSVVKSAFFEAVRRQRIDADLSLRNMAANAPAAERRAFTF